MNIKINIDNYEEIMFRLMEGDFDQNTRANLLRQIESDELFKFEWKSWQKSTWVDPIENYFLESEIIAEKIISQTQAKTIAVKRRWYYAAASTLLLIGVIVTYLFIPDFTSGDKQLANKKKEIHQPEKPAPTIATSPKPIKPQKNKTSKERVTNLLPAKHTVVDTSLQLKQTEPLKDHLAEKQEIFASEKKEETLNIDNEKTHYTVIAYTTNIPENEVAQVFPDEPKKTDLKKVLTNTRMFFSRKSNGKPNKIYLVGEDNNYLCINLKF